MPYSESKVALVFLFLIAISFSVSCPTGTSLIPNCAACTAVNSNIVCSLCINGYYLASTTCISCSSVITYCQYCALNVAGQPICSVCQSNYGLLNSTCQACSSITGCLTCQITNYNLQCIKCNTNLVLYSAQMACIPCQIPNCLNCSISNLGVFSCFSCQPEYYLSNNICNSCNQGIPYCQSCQIDSNSKLICARCASIYMTLSNNTCTANCSKAGLPQCTICTLVSASLGTMTCSACVANYYLQSVSQTCKACGNTINGCLNCTTSTVSSSNSSVVVTCNECSSGYYIASSTCVSCSSVVSNCLSCSFKMSGGNGECTQCLAGYFLNSTDKSCYTCSSFNSLTFPVDSCSNCSLNGLFMVCFACNSGYYLSDQTCLTCSNLQANCRTCNFSSIFNCQSCNNGYLINAIGQCQACSTIYTNCSQCNSVQCTDCLPGFYTTDNKKCLINCAISNCATCVSLDNSKCRICSPGYSLTSSLKCSITGCSAPLIFDGAECTCAFTSYLGTSNTCVPCGDSNCLICPNNFCKTCLPGYFMRNSSSPCQSCLNNCQICNNTSTCSLCIDGYFLVNGQCSINNATIKQQLGIIISNNFYVLCGKGCVFCQAVTSCLSCSNGYYMNNSVCIPCQDNCKACQISASNVTQVVCLLCNSGTALLNSICQLCSDPNCVRCDMNINFCLLCSVTYTPNTQGLCSLCASNCDFCDNSGPGLCDSYSCSLGYGQFNSTICLRCLNGCTSCNGIYPFNCIGCLIGSYPTVNQTCQNCPIGCQACVNSVKCLYCSPLYVLSGGVCNPKCNLPCVSCTFTNQTQICQSCLEGYLVLNSSCVPDFSCKGTLICQFCPLGYFSYRGNCYECMSNCWVCILTPNNPTFAVQGLNYLQYLTCSSCSSKYYLSAGGTCNMCPTNCSKCISLNLCYQCSPGSFLQYKLLNGQGNLNYSVGVCKPCISNCLTCDNSPSRCTSCFQNFYLSNFICLSLTNISFSFSLTSSSNSTNSTVFNNVANNFPSFYLGIASLLGYTFVQNPYLLMINSIVNGSVIISGNAGIDSNSNNPSTLYNSASSNVQSAQYINGYSISSYSLVAQGFTPTDSASSSSQSYIIYIIIGAAILGVILIAIIVYLCIRARRRRKANQRHIQSQKEQTENQPATSKNMLKNSHIFQQPEKPKRRSKLPIKERSHISDNNSNEAEQRQQPSKSKTKKNIPIQSISTRQKKAVKQTGKTNENNLQESQENKTQQINNASRRNRQERQRGFEEQKYQERQRHKNLNQESKSKPKSSKNIHYQEQRNISVARQVKKSKTTNQIRFLKNQSNYSESQKTQKKQIIGSKKQESSSRKYIPNANTHFI